MGAVHLGEGEGRRGLKRKSGQGVKKGSGQGGARRATGGEHGKRLEV